VNNAGEIQQIEKFPEECKNCIFAWVTGRCGGAEIQFPHSGTAVKPYPGETFRSTEIQIEKTAAGVPIRARSGLSAEFRGANVIDLRPPPLGEGHRGG
jgi:hypothetical protein